MWNDIVADDLKPKLLLVNRYLPTLVLGTHLFFNTKIIFSLNYIPSLKLSDWDDNIRNKTIFYA